VWAWGNNESGQLGDGTRQNRNQPVHVLDNAKKISSGGWFGLGYNLLIKNDDTVWAWGNNMMGQLGNGNVQDQLIPLQISSPAN